MEVLSAANARDAAGLPTYHLEVGQPGAPVPPLVQARAEETLRTGRIGYTEAAGIMPLRERIAHHYRDYYGLSVPASRIFVTTGSSAGFSLAFLMLCEPGDRIALPRPGYPAYRNIVSALGLDAVEIDLSPQDDWCLTPEKLLAAHAEKPLKAVLLASPNNPTGTLTSPEMAQKLTQACCDAGIWYISDEIYHGLTYEGEETCALAFDDDAIIINSFSKYYCMTGWRIGWMVMPERLIQRATALAQNLFICPPTLSQMAAQASLDARDDLERIKDGYRVNRARLLQTQERLGLKGGPSPDGAFYIYWPINHLLKEDETALSFCQALLDETGVAITPGNDFDPSNGGSFVRVSFAGSQETIAKAADLFEAWAEKRLSQNS